MDAKVTRPPPRQRSIDEGVVHCASGLYLEDLYVKEDFRGRGLNSALMQELSPSLFRARLHPLPVVRPQLKQSVN
jgi:GNAT superfamily N-acetyltransferase